MQLTVAAVPAAQADSGDPQQVIAQQLAIGKQFLEQGHPEDAQEQFRSILQLDATHPEALRLMTKAQRQIDAARLRTERARSRLREQAQRLAVEVAREKARAKTQQASEAKQQVAQAREQQLKYLYNRGLRLYDDQAYQDAISTLQQMVLMDPDHPLVHAAQRLISRAETKLAEARARARMQLSPQPGTGVPELKQQLAAKRIEIDTLLKYAKLALKDRNYDLVMQLTQQVLASDPQHQEAQELLERTQLAKLDAEQQRLEHLVERDERVMVNDVVKAQLLPESNAVRMSPRPAAIAAKDAMSARLQQPISLEFEEVPLRDVLEFIADAANVSIIPSPKLDLKERLASLKISELPLEQAIKYLAKSQSLAYRVEEDAILLATPEEFENEPLQTRVFYLHSGIGPFALETAALASNPLLAMESLKSLIEQSVPQPSDSKFVFDERSGALIVTNTAENLGLVERLLGQLDVTPVQVLIEARFVELSLTDLEHAGLETVLTSDTALTKKMGSNGSLGPGNIIASGSGFKFPVLSRESEGLNLTLQGVLTGTQFEMALHLLEETKKSKTLSAPRVTTLNNQPALIRVVDEFRYPTRYEVSLVQFDINGDGDFDDAGETEFVNVPQDFQKRDVGILMNVTPSVGKDMKTITLILAPEVSSFSQFRDLGGGVTVPEFTSSQLTTSVVIEDGQTVVLGGLMKDSISETVTKVPFFGNLPVLGSLFRQKSESATKKNLLIFITARMLAPRGPTT